MLHAGLSAWSALAPSKVIESPNTAAAGGLSAACAEPDRSAGNGNLQEFLATHSHSMVPGGLLVMSTVTRLISRTSLVMRVEMASSTS